MTASQITAESRRLHKYLLAVWSGERLATYYQYGSWGMAIQHMDVFRDNANASTTHYTVHDPDSGHVCFPLVEPQLCEWNASRAGDVRYIKGIVRNGNFEREAFYGPFTVADVKRRLLKNQSGHTFMHYGQFWRFPVSRDTSEAA